MVIRPDRYASAMLATRSPPAVLADATIARNSPCAKYGAADAVPSPAHI